FEQIRRRGPPRRPIASSGGLRKGDFAMGTKRGTWFMALMVLRLTGCGDPDDIDDSGRPAAAVAAARTDADRPHARRRRTLYDHLGGHQCIANFVELLVSRAVADPEIGRFFADVGKPGHPNATQVEACFTQLVSARAGGREQYPITVAGGFTCRTSMREIHR